MNPIEALMETATPLQRKLLEGCRYVPETGCWEWVGTHTTTRQGRYGTPTFNHSGRSDFAARFAFCEFVGPLDDRDTVKRSCKNKKCISPTHAKIKEDYYAGNGYWTKEKCREEALKYTRRVDFKNGSPSAYATAGAKRWLKEITSHIETNQKYSGGYWTEERCAAEALKYDTPQKFKNGSVSAYSILQKAGLLEKYCSHMEKIESRPDGYWDNKENCLFEAAKYKTVSDFMRKNSWGAGRARQHGWTDEIRQLYIDRADHRVDKNVPRGYWTKEKCAEEARNYESRNELAKDWPSISNIARSAGWWDEICAHMEFPKSVWDDKENCALEAAKYTKRNDFSIGSQAAYRWSCKNGWIDEFFPNSRKPLTYEECRDIAANCKGRHDLEKKNNSVYKASRRNGWLDEFFPKPA